MTGDGWRGRLRRFVLAAVAPLFQQQQDFNATIVDHVNRNVEAHRHGARAVAEALAVAREEFARLVGFQSTLVHDARRSPPT